MTPGMQPAAAIGNKSSSMIFHQNESIKIGKEGSDDSSQRLSVEYYCKNLTVLANTESQVQKCTNTDTAKKLQLVWRTGKNVSESSKRLSIRYILASLNTLSGVQCTIEYNEERSCTSDATGDRHKLAPCETIENHDKRLTIQVH